ncbi:MAG TPA: hypothetical protein VIJ28_20970 [Chloroflexota bacterium]
MAGQQEQRAEGQAVQGIGDRQEPAVGRPSQKHLRPHVYAHDGREGKDLQPPGDVGQGTSSHQARGLHPQGKFQPVAKKEIGFHIERAVAAAEIAFRERAVREIADPQPVGDRQPRHHPNPAPAKAVDKPDGQGKGQIKLGLHPEGPERAVDAEHGVGEQGMHHQQMGPDLPPGDCIGREGDQPCLTGQGFQEDGQKENGQHRGIVGRQDAAGPATEEFPGVKHGIWFGERIIEAEAAQHEEEVNPTAERA